MAEATLVPVQNKRNYGIDALRIMSMFMVLVIHIVSKGGLTDAVDKVFTPDYDVVWFLWTFSVVAVNCFAMISGYVGVNARYRYSSLALLWLRVLYYSVLVVAVFQIFWPDKMGWKRWTKAFFPVIYNQYWYFTAYFLMFLLIPLLNLALHKLSRKQSGLMILLLLFALSVLQTVPHYDLFRMQDGYSGWWLGMMYLVGGYIRKYDLFRDVKKGKCFLIYALASLTTYASILLLDFIDDKLPEKLIEDSKLMRYLTNYCSPTVVIASIAFFMFFAKLEVKSDYTKRLISFFSPLAFSVYLIHYSPLIRDKMLDDAMEKWVRFSAPKLGIAIVCVAIAVFIGCCLIDVIREVLFRKLRLKERLQALEDRLVGDLWKGYTD